MAVVDQPQGLVSDNGVILTIGLKSPASRTAIVLPVATDTPPSDPRKLSSYAVAAFLDEAATLLCECICITARIAFIQAEPMMNGRVPFRTGLGAEEYPGTRMGEIDSSNVAALIGFYGLQEDQQNQNGRVHYGKNFIGCLAEADTPGDLILADLIDKLYLFADKVASGMSASSPEATGTWYRVLRGPLQRTESAALPRVGTTVVRSYPVTQRRRLLPHWDS